MIYSFFKKPTSLAICLSILGLFSGATGQAGVEVDFMSVRPADKPKSIFSAHTFKIPLFELSILDALPENYKKVCDFLKSNPSAQNLSLFARKNPKMSAFIGVTSCVGIYALLFHGLSIFTKRSKNRSDNDSTFDEMQPTA